MAVALPHRHWMVRAGNGAVFNAAQPLAGIEVKRQAIASITGTDAAVGNRVGNGQNVGDIDDHNHIEEVNHSNNDHRWIPVRNGPV